MPGASCRSLCGRWLPVASDGEYRVVYDWADREGLWTNTAMARELLQKLEQERQKIGSVLSRAQIISDEMVECARDKTVFLDRVAAELVQEIWAAALRSKLIPLELPQVERCEDCGFRGVKIRVSMRCVDAPQQKEG